MHDTIKSMRCQQDIGLGARRVPGIRPSQTMSLRFAGSFVTRRIHFAEPSSISFFRATLCCVLNNLSDFRWPPKYLRSREGQPNRGWKSWVQIHRGEASGIRRGLASHLCRQTHEVSEPHHFSRRYNSLPRYTLDILGGSNLRNTFPIVMG
jgi:hypothetical protein